MRAYVMTILLCLFSFFLIGASLKSVSSITSLPEILRSKYIEAMSYWHYGDNTFLVVVTNYNKDTGSTKLAGRKLTVYNKQNSGFVKAFEYDAALDHFVGMFPLSDNSNNLMIMWTGGSAYHFTILSMSNGRILPVLETGSHSMPELADTDNDGQLEILLSEGSLLIDAKENKILKYPDATATYKWNGKSYVLIKKVSWKTRFNCGNQ